MTKKSDIVLWASFAAIALLHLASINNQLNGLGGDNARYVMVARSLAESLEFRDFFPGMPFHIHYPPVFPLLLAPVIWLFGVNFAACHAVVVVTELVALLMLFLLFNRLAGRTVAAVSCLLFALNPFVNLSLVRILSEFPYMAFASAALYLASRAEAGKQVKLFWLPLLVALAYLTRSAGLSLMVAFLVYLAFKKEFRLLLLNLPVLLLPRAVWTLRNKIVTSGQDEGYLNVLWLKDRLDPGQGNISLSDFFERISANASKLTHGIADFVYPIGGEYPLVLIIGINAIVVLGFLLFAYKQRHCLMNIYLVVYLGMLLIWPVYEPRKLMPVIPLIFFYFFWALNHGSLFYEKKLKESLADTSMLIGLTRKISPLLLFGLVLALCQVPAIYDIFRVRTAEIRYPSKEDARYGGFEIDWSHYRETYGWVRSGRLDNNMVFWADYLYLSDVIGKNSEPGSAIIARKPTLVALFSGRPAIDYPFFNDFEKQKKHIMENEIDYILLDRGFRETARYLAPFVNANPQAFQIIAQTRTNMVVQVRRDKL